MVLPRYLAQTATEMAGNPIPEFPAFLSCHFSPGGRGLSNLPRCLPPGAMLILDDSTPMDGHDPELVASQLSRLMEETHFDVLLLDFQRKNLPEQQELAVFLRNTLPCPVGISEDYARELPCPVFLPPVPPDVPADKYLHPWQGREIWLETALDGIDLTLTEAGCALEPLGDFPEDGHRDSKLHCHYTVETAASSARFRLWRTKEDLNELLEDLRSLGVTKAVGLWQELKGR